MRNEREWVETKYVFAGGRLMASRLRSEVNVGSRLITDLIAGAYQTHLPDNARGRLLDLGCGKVPLYRAYRPLVDDIVCVDWANTLHKNPYLDQEVDLSGPLPFADGAFDTVILSDVLEHIPVPQQLLAEIGRVLAPGGKLLLNVPFYYQIHEAPHDYYRFTEFALRRFIELTNLQLLSLYPIGGAPEVVADVLAKNVARIPGVGVSTAALIQWVTLKMVRSRWGKRLSSGTADKFPFGYFLVAEK